MRWWTVVLICLTVGCGTTKWTDTARTATEQLLISDAMDHAVSRLDFRALAGKKVFLDDAPVKTMVDSAYLVSTLRQHVLASGAVLKEKREEAEYVMEVRAGAIGTDNHSVLFGVPATNLPTVSMVPAMPTQIPEIALIKRTEQRAVAKLYMFVYNRETGRPLWQSGAIPEESHAKATWIFGAGPFQRGNIYGGTKFAFDRFDIPLVDLGDEMHDKRHRVAVADEAFFVEPKEPARLAKTGADPKAAAVPNAPPAEANANGKPPLATTPPVGPAGPAPQSPQAGPPQSPQAGPGPGQSSQVGPPQLGPGPLLSSPLPPNQYPPGPGPGPGQSSQVGPQQVGPGPGPGPEVIASRSRWIGPDDSAPMGQRELFQGRSGDRWPPALEADTPSREPLREPPHEFELRLPPYGAAEGDSAPWPR